MPRLVLTSSGLQAADGGRPRDTRRGRHLEPGRRFRSTGAYQRLRAQVFAEEPACALCGSTEDPHMDHIVPTSRGGAPLERGNVRRLCGACNTRRGARAEARFFEDPPAPHPVDGVLAVRTGSQVRAGAA